MSSRYLIPLAVAAALAAPVAANAEEGTYDPGKWLVRVGMSQINPDSTNYKLDDSTSIVVDSDISPTATVEYMITPHIGTELLVAWPFTHGIDLKSYKDNVQRVWLRRRPPADVEPQLALQSDRHGPPVRRRGPQLHAVLG